MFKALSLFDAMFSVFGWVVNRAEYKNKEFIFATSFLKNFDTNDEKTT